jgi:cyclic beta-1,2-glucan synthetase
VRTLVRQIWTRQRLLDWETAAEAEEHSRQRAAVDRYLEAMPWLSAGLAVTLVFLRPEAIYVAAPILGLWTSARWLVPWLDRAPAKSSGPLEAAQEQWLRKQALRTWGYFRDGCTEGVNWLIPDNVQEIPPKTADHLSPTNLGLLLNSRLVAFDLGYLTLPELVGLSERTLDVAEGLRRHRGHLFNWYDCHTLEPLPPHFISSVDSGNLAACLWTLGQACKEFLDQPVFQQSLWAGLRDHAGLLAETARGADGEATGRQARELLTAIEKMATTGDARGFEVLEEQTQGLGKAPAAGKRLPSELGLMHDEARLRIRAIRLLLETLLPWALPEHWEASQRLGVVSSWQTITLSEASNTAEQLRRRLEESAGPSMNATDERLRQRLWLAEVESRRLADRLTNLAQRCDSWVREMDFCFLFSRERGLLSIGYDADQNSLHKACYDLMASEARLATFLAIAKGDIPLETWFRLTRSYTVTNGERVLLSWSGTMFEYLMPTLWMRNYPETLLRQNIEAAIRCQRRFGARFGGVWGISESAHAARDAEGRYGYRAFGVPGLALDPDAGTGVLAPYATFLCLPFAPTPALENLQSLALRGWVGRFGFYESVDFRPAHRGANGEPEVIRSWMVHHEGMSLLATGNLLAGESNIRRFHRVPAVKGIERLLQESVPLGVRAAPGRDGKARRAD